MNNIYLITYDGTPLVACADKSEALSTIQRAVDRIGEYITANLKWDAFANKYRCINEFFDIGDGLIVGFKYSCYTTEGRTGSADYTRMMFDITEIPFKEATDHV